MKFTKGTIVHSIATAVAGLSAVGTSAVLACGTDPYIGSICATAATYCPANQYLEANGQLLAISQYQALFSLLGNYYGGNGTTDFALPDMRGRSPVGVGTGPGLTAVTTGQRRGIDFMTLTIQQLPMHSHTAIFTPGGEEASASLQASTKVATKAQAADGDYIASNNPLGGAPKFIGADDAEPTVALGGISGGGGGGTVQVGDTGGNQSFANYPPQQALKYCIAVDGIYPTRP